MKLFFFLSFLVLASCRPTSEKVSIKNPFVGYLHANSCMGGSSYLVYNDKQYAFGSRSNAQLNRTVQEISQGTTTKASVLSSKGCEKVFKMEFAGEFEKESALTGYGNDELRQVVQVYQFRLL